MPYLLEDLIVNRVDLVDDGANSEAFIELYKRKEQNVMTVTEVLSKMKPEHAAVIQDEINKAKEELSKAQEDLANVTTERDEAKEECDKVKEELTTANEDLENTKSELESLKAEKACGGKDDDPEKSKSGSAFDETETFKSMPQEIKDMFAQLKAQKEAAEEQIRKAKDAEETAKAVSKAKELKAIPVDQEKLVGIIKNANADILDLLTVVNAAIEGSVLGEVGKSNPGSTAGSNDAWSKIEAKADEVAKRDSITKAKAIAVVLDENPELYREYLNGGAN